MGYFISSSARDRTLDAQRERLVERKNTDLQYIRVFGRDFVIRRGVYRTGPDTALQIQNIPTSPAEVILDVGCGAGVASAFLALRSGRVLGVDISPAAVENAVENARLIGVKNAEFLVSDGLAEVRGEFDIIICNPPYLRHEVTEVADRMFWDPADSMKLGVLAGVHRYLRTGGRFYFGSADFGDLEEGRVLEMTRQHSLLFNRVFSTRKAGRTFRLLEFIKHAGLQEGRSSPRNRVRRFTTE